MALKLKEEYGWFPLWLILIEDAMIMVLELFRFAFNIIKQVCDVLDGFLSFLTKYEEKETHNMFF
jgi:hypothetical protein